MERRAARARKAAVLVPLFGAFLLLPPFLRVFAHTGAVAGVPLVLCHLFGVWALLVGAAAWLAARLPQDGEPAAGHEPPPPA